MRVLEQDGVVRITGVLDAGICSTARSQARSRKPDGGHVDEFGRISLPTVTRYGLSGGEYSVGRDACRNKKDMRMVMPRSQFNVHRSPWTASRVLIADSDTPPIRVLSDAGRRRTACDPAEEGYASPRDGHSTHLKIPGGRWNARRDPWRDPSENKPYGSQRIDIA